MVPPAANASPGAAANGVPSAILRKGFGLYSPGGGFRFFLQDDGNAVIQVIDDATINRKWTTGALLGPATSLPWLNPPIWANGTNDQGVSQIDMQSDGNLVAYASGGGPGAPDRNGTLPSNTNGNPGAFLRMQDDGNLVIYANDSAALWASNTNAEVH
jgi:hypothetical protein